MPAIARPITTAAAGRNEASVRSQRNKYNATVEAVIAMSTEAATRSGS
jgi:hypothetical protein